MQPTSQFDLVIRTDFEGSSDAVPTWISTQVGPCTVSRYMLGTNLAAVPSVLAGTAPFLVFMDDCVILNDEVLRNVFEFLTLTPQCAGVTLNSPALAPMYGDFQPDDSAQTIAPVAALPSWFSILRRDAIAPSVVDERWETPEFLLFDVAACAPASTLFLRLGNCSDLTMNTETWVRDLLARSSLRLANDFARFRQRHDLALVPPQFQIDAVGRYTATPELKPHMKTAQSYPKFSIVCPVFKPEFLREMISSVKQQSWQNWELMILVDGPPEPFLGKIEALLQKHGDDPRITYSTQANRGTGPTRNALAASATGDFILSLDDDDELTPDALEAFASAILHNPGVPFFRGGARLVGLAQRDMRPRPRLMISGISNDIFEVTQPFVISRDALATIGGFMWDKYLRNAGEDTLLFQKIDRLRVETRIIDRVLYHRRLSSTNLTLELKPEEAIAHSLNLDLLSRPPEWTLMACNERVVDGFQQASSTYRRDDGRQVICSTQYFQYRTLGSVGETTIDLELTSKCNAVCTFCPREVMPDKTLFLPVELVEALAGHLKSLRRKPNIVLCGIGESTLHPELEKITKILSATGAFVSMTTNGERMTPEFFQRLVLAGLSAFNFSLNAATAKTHRDVMKFKAFDKINATLDQIILIRRQSYYKTILNVSFVVCSQNEHEVEDFVNYWRWRDVSQVWLHPINNRSGLVDESARPVSLDRYARMYSGDPRVVVDVLPKEEEGDAICKVARSFMFISAEGEVRLCAMDYRRHTHYGNIGAVNLQSAHNKKLLAFLAGDTRSLCETCDFFPNSLRQQVEDFGTRFLPILGHEPSLESVR